MKVSLVIKGILKMRNAGECLENSAVMVASLEGLDREVGVRHGAQPPILEVAWGL
jgi:hypothetical protein